MKNFNQFRKIIGNLKKISLSDSEKKTLKQDLIDEISPELSDQNIFSTSMLSYRVIAVSVFLIVMNILLNFK